METETKSMDIFGNVSSSNKNDEPIRIPNAISESDLTYDQKFKQLFADKVFLAPILKNIVPEYEDCELETIEGLINPYSDIEVNYPVYGSEDSGKGKETVTHYDVLVDCALPNGEKVCVDFFFDLEMQRESQPGYSIPKRGVYYCCRLISRQIKTLKDEAYDQLKPVYSVWILINDIPKEKQYSIYTAGMHGQFSDRQIDASEINSQSDLIHLCLIYLSNDFKIEEDQNDLIKYLQSVFIKQVSNPKYNPYSDYSRRIEKEVDDTMTFRESFEERGRKRGIEEGRAEGIIAVLLDGGKTDAEILQYLTTMKSHPLTVDQARNALERYKEENPLLL